MSIKIFCDIADLKLIKKFNKKKIVKGFTKKPKFNEKSWGQKLSSIFKTNTKSM